MSMSMCQHHNVLVCGPWTTEPKNTTCKWELANIFICPESMLPVDVLIKTWQVTDWVESSKSKLFLHVAMYPTVWMVLTSNIASVFLKYLSSLQRRTILWASAKFAASVDTCWLPKILSMSRRRLNSEYVSQASRCSSGMKLWHDHNDYHCAWSYWIYESISVCICMSLSLHFLM